MKQIPIQYKPRLRVDVGQTDALLASHNETTESSIYVFADDQA